MQLTLDEYCACGTSIYEECDCNNDDISENDYKAEVYELGKKLKLMIHEDGRWKMAKDRYFNNILTTATFTWESAFYQLKNTNIKGSIEDGKERDKT